MVVPICMSLAFEAGEKRSALDCDSWPEPEVVVARQSQVAGCLILELYHMQDLLAGDVDGVVREGETEGAGEGEGEDVAGLTEEPASF